MGIPYLKELILKDQAFLLLAAIIAVSLVLVILFALVTVHLRLRNMRMAKRWQRLEAEWEPIVLDFLVGERTPEAVRERIKQKDSLYFLDFLLRFAQRLRGQEATAITQLAEPYLPALVAHVKKGDPTRRARAIQTLSLLGLDRYPEVVIAALDDSSPLVAMIAARALARKDHPEYAELILDKLHRFENWSRSYLVSMLTSVGPEVAPALRKTLADPEKPLGIRAVSADTLRSLNDLEAADLATRLLGNETNRDLIAAALRLLAEVGRPEHLEPVRRLCNSEDFVVRAQALRALGRLGGTEDLQLLRQGADDDSSWVALHAARGLREAGGEQLLHELSATEHPRSNLARQVLAEGGAV